MEKSSALDAHSFAARNFAHLYAVGGRQHSVDAVAKVQIESKRTMVENETGITKSYRRER